MKTFFAIVGFFCLFVVVGAMCAFCGDDENDKDSVNLGKVVLISHERDRCYNADCDDGSGNDGDYRDDNRRAGISPGPFDRSPVDHSFNPTVCVMPNSCSSPEPENGKKEKQPQ